MFKYWESCLEFVLTPHVLSDGNVEWCSFNVCVFRSVLMFERLSFVLVFWFVAFVLVF